MKVLVAYASRAGSTKGIAEFIGEKLQKDGMQVDVRDVSGVGDVASYDAFVVGSALYMYHWLKEARQFVQENRAILAARPVWLFSSGPTGPREIDSKGSDLRQTSGPKEIDELRESISPRDHRVFFGALFPDRLKGATGYFARWTPKEEQGDFRNWPEIEAWAVTIARALTAAPAEVAADLTS